MSGKFEGSLSFEAFTSTQIETLQKQIRLFKQIGKRYADLKIPKSVEDRQPVSAPVATTLPSSQLPPPNLQNQINVTTSFTKEESSSLITINPYSENLIKNEYANSATTRDPNLGTMTWQCSHALLFTGPPRNPYEGMISLHPTNMGCFVKSATNPLILSQPFVSTLREKVYSRLCHPEEELNKHTQHEKDQTIEAPTTHMSEAHKLWLMQRADRSSLISHALNRRDTSPENAYSSSVVNINIHPPSSFGNGSYVSELLPRKNFHRTKRYAKKDVRLLEREEKRKKQEIDDKRKKKMNEYIRVVMAHREEFLRFHKTKRQDCIKLARALKQRFDDIDVRKQREETKTEARRLQALRENDMDSYLKLVQDTKNDRLKYLINETDTYINAINLMIQQQRQDGTLPLSNEKNDKVEEDMQVDAGGEVVKKAIAIPTAASVDESSVSKKYMTATHRVSETISQPVMLKGGDLKEYQLSGVQWMVSLYNNNLNGILADEMGLGKTIQTIALLAYVMETKHNRGPFLIVCPLSTLSNWANETSKWAPDMIKVVYKGAPQIRKQIYKDDIEHGHFNVLLTTYEYIMKDKTTLRKIQWQYIIVDEGHRMKNAQSKFAQTLGTQYFSKNRILLTGTPLQNSLPELWALLNFLLPTIFSSVDTFDQWFNKPFSAFKTQQQQHISNDTAGAGGEQDVAVLTQEEQMLIIHRLHEVLRPFVLRRVKLQVLDQLPEKVEKILRCDFSGWQRLLYRSVHARSIASKEVKEASQGINNVWMQLRKVCNHPYLFLSDYIIDEDLIRISGKFELLNRMLPKLKVCGHRVLMFSQMTQLMTVLENFFVMKGFKYLRLDGNTSSDERERRMYEFNDPDSPYFIFLLSTRAGGLGLNLATADTVIIFDSDWNPMMDAQAQDRAHRIGQRNEVRVFRLITNSVIEERILSRATDKMNLNSLVVEAGKFNQREKNEFNSEESREMMEALLKEWSTGGAAANTSEEPADQDEGDVPDGDQLNEMMALNDSELAIYQRMDVEAEIQRQVKWVEKHRLEGVTGVRVPALPPRLMTADENPVWLRPEVWQSRYHRILPTLFNGGVVPSIGGKKAMIAGTAGRGRKKKDRVASTSGGGGVKEEGEVSDDNDEGEGASDDDDNDMEEEFMEEEEAVDEGSTVIAGKVMRKRKDITYDDGMSDLQFANYLEREATDGTKPSTGPALSSLDPSRRSSGAPIRYTEDLSQLEGPSSSSRGGRSSKSIAFNSMLPPRSKLPDVLSTAITKIIQDIVKLRRSDGSFLAELFKDKPNKKFFPDYYIYILQPISLKEISTKASKYEYACLQEVENDFALMSHNARTFNLETSPVFRDCEQIRTEFYTRLWSRFNSSFAITSSSSSSSQLVQYSLPSYFTSTPPALPPQQAGHVVRDMGKGSNNNSAKVVKEVLLGDNDDIDVNDIDGNDDEYDDGQSGPAVLSLKVGLGGGVKKKKRSLPAAAGAGSAPSKRSKGRSKSASRRSSSAAVIQEPDSFAEEEEEELVEFEEISSNVAAKSNKISIKSARKNSNSRNNRFDDDDDDDGKSRQKRGKRSKAAPASRSSSQAKKSVNPPQSKKSSSSLAVPAAAVHYDDLSQYDDIDLEETLVGDGADGGDGNDFSGSEADYLRGEEEEEVKAFVNPYANSLALSKVGKSKISSQGSANGNRKKGSDDSSSATEDSDDDNSSKSDDGDYDDASAPGNKLSNTIRTDGSLQIKAGTKKFKLTF